MSDSKQSYTLTGNGDVIEPHDGIIGIGSGGTYALGTNNNTHVSPIIAMIVKLIFCFMFTS